MPKKIFNIAAKLVAGAAILYSSNWFLGKVNDDLTQATTVNQADRRYQHALDSVYNIAVAKKDTQKIGEIAPKYIESMAQTEKSWHQLNTVENEQMAAYAGIYIGMVCLSFGALDIVRRRQQKKQATPGTPS